jgi:hypothetical protein
MLCGEFLQTAATRGSKLMFGSSSWNPSGSVRVLIAVGLAIIGAALVWTALARPSTPEAAPAPGTNDQSMPSTSFSAPRVSPGRPTAGDKTDLRDKTTGVVLPESDPVVVSIPRIGVRSRLAKLGLDDHGAMDVPAKPPMLAGSLEGPRRVSWGRPSSPDT